MKMRSFFLSIISLLSVYLVNAQTISGFVFSLPEKNPVEFANVLILKLPDSSMVKGLITYMDGQYTIADVKPGKYYVRASIVGYNNNGTQVEITGSSTVTNADTIFLSERANELNEVEVKGEYIRAKELVDRTQYEILPEIEKTSTNGYDVLKKIPSVQVDFNNNVTLNGKSNFIIQVDGKQRDKEFLARLLPSDIESIEVIHNPSGKYEGDIDGVINIILKEGARVGINGNFGVQVKPVGKTTMVGFGSLDYGREKVTFYASGFSFIQNLANNTIDYSRITKYENLRTVDSVLDMNGAGSFSVSASSINTGCDYYLNSNNSFSLNYSYKPFRMENNLSNSGNILLNEQMLNYQESANEILSKSGESNISLFYRKKFKKPIQELTVETNYYFYNSKDTNSFNSSSFLSDTAISWLMSESTGSHREYFSSKVDYVHPVGVSIRLEAGYQLYWQSMEYDFTSSNRQSSNLFNYFELRNAGYASFFWNVKNISIQGTVRVENSNIDINKEIPTQYTTVLPSSNLLYKLNTNQNIKLTYNRRINRPGVYNLNPYEKNNNDFSISRGNPYLKPEYKDKIQLTYTLNIKKVNLSPYVYHELYSNKIDTRSSLKKSPITGNMAIINSPDNILSGFEQGAGLNATLWNVNINGSIYKGHFDAYSDTMSTIEPRDYWSFRLNSFVYAPLFKQKLNVFAMFNYNGVNISAESKSYSPMIYGFGGQYNLKNHSFGVFYLLPLSKEIVFNKTIKETPLIYSENTSSFDASWFVQVMYSYKFNKGRSIKKTDRKSEVESDTKGGGLGR